MNSSSDSSDSSDSELDDVMYLLSSSDSEEEEEEEEEEGIPRVPREISRPQAANVVYDCLHRDQACIHLVRMPCRTLRLLIQRIVRDYGFDTNGHVMSAEEQIIMALYYLAHAATMSATSVFFGRSKHAVHLVVERMLEPLGRLFRDEIISVDQNHIHSKFTKNNLKSAFKDCIGAIDGTHVHVYPKKAKSLKWIGRSSAKTTNCLGICDHNMMFTYFFVGAQGAMHDARVLEEAESKPVHRFPTPIPGKYYLGDSGYTNRTGFLTPFRRVRYHPHEFDGQRPSNERELFNKMHSSLRSVIERTFGIWKNKWHISHFSEALKGFPLRKQLALIQVTVGLHNFVRRNKLESEPEDEDTSAMDLGTLDFHLPPTMAAENEARRRIDHRMDDFRDELADYIYNPRNRNRIRNR